MVLRIDPVMRKIMLGGAMALAVAAAGCVAIPPHESTALPAPDTYKLDRSVSVALSSPAFTRGAWPQPDWWRAFGDPQLDRLMDAALAGNPDIRIAAARVRRAEQIAAVARGDNFPDVSANASVTRERFSKNWLIPPELAVGAKTEGQLSLDLSYDLDLWNRNRDVYRARLDETQAAAADHAETRLAISAALAGTYFRLHDDLVRLALARDALAQRRSLAQLIGLRADHGLETAAAVKTADADVAREQANVVALTRAADADKREIASLTGKGPDDAMTIDAPAIRVEETFPVPDDLPADLLARRPDIAAQRWRVEAAAREIGAAKAGFYPNINLAASAGVQSIELKDLFKSDSVFSAVGPAIHLPIFHGGHLRAELGARYAEYDVAVEQYHRTLVDAARQVADRLAAIQSLARERGHQEEALRDSEEAYRIARLRYEKGVSDYLTVLQAQRDLLQQRDVNTRLGGARLQAIVELIRALGGGYTTADAPPARS
jgi:NodT family efflux transporter outer membrane factor (OMF) lipoprotein